VTSDRTLTVASSNPSSGVSITVSPGDKNGQGNGATQFTRTYANGTVVTLTAPLTAGGNNFQKWQRNGVDYSTSQTTTMTIDANYTMTANFSQVNYTLSLSKSGNGSVKVNGVLQSLPWSGTFSSGSTVQLEAVSDTGWRFSYWSGDLSGSTNPTSITMNGNRTVTAYFSHSCVYTLTVNINPSGLGTVTKNPNKSTYCSGEQVTLTASPSSGYTFSYWSGVDSSSGTTAYVTMNGNRTVTANFNATTYFLSFVEGDPGIPGDGVFISSDGGEFDFGFALATPIPLGQFMDGFTATVFLRGSDIQKFNCTSFNTNEVCGWHTGFGMGYSGSTIFNGVEGIFTNVPQSRIQNMVDNINQLSPGCNATANDFFITSIALGCIIPGGGVTTLDAFTILPGQTAVPSSRCDFNGDGKTDILWRNKSTGQNVVWLMNGTTYSSYAELLQVADTNWQIVGTGDFNSDGKTDIVWRNKSTGQNVVWLMDGVNYGGYAWLLEVADLNWEIVGTGDFNSDGKVDILWRNKATGENVVWYMDGVTRTGWSYIEPAVSDLNWEIVGTGDFNSDGKTDILWRNKSTGQNVVWFMDGVAYGSYAWLLEVTDLNWEIVGTGDFNGNGKTDILWRNKSTGQNVVWLMNGTTYNSYTWLPDVPDTNWEIVGPK